MNESNQPGLQTEGRQIPLVTTGITNADYYQGIRRRVPGTATRTTRGKYTEEYKRILKEHLEKLDGNVKHLGKMFGESPSSLRDALKIGSRATLKRHRVPLLNTQANYKIINGKKFRITPYKRGPYGVKKVAVKSFSDIKKLALKTEATLKSGNVTDFDFNNNSVFIAKAIESIDARILKLNTAKEQLVQLLEVFKDLK